MTPPTDAPLSVANAERLIASHLVVLPSERVPIDSAHGRVLREDIVADRDQPPFHRAMMDGIAVASDDTSTTLRVSAQGAAGQPALQWAGRGTCVEIMTGAPMPTATDCVVPVEDITRTDAQVTLTSTAQRAAWRYVHRQGSDHTAGTRLLEPGGELGGPELAVVAAAGLADVAVTRQARITVVATGDELVDVGRSLAPHQIRRTNDYAAAALLQRHGLGSVKRVHARDDREQLRATLARALEASDVIVVSGGVSKGRYDYVGDALEALGVTKVFHRVAQKPGKPMWFGIGADGQPVFALPGNPVSALVCLRRYVVPALEQMRGRTRELTGACAVLSDMVTFSPHLTWFAPARCRDDDAGRRVAQLQPTNTSGDFTALAGTDGFVQLDAELDRFAAGFVAPWYPW